MADLQAVAAELRAALEAMPGATDVRDSLGALGTEARFRARGEALSFYGLDESTLMEHVRIAMTADEVGTFSMPGAQPDLDIRLGMDFPSRPEGEIGGPRELCELETMAIVTERGERVPVANLVETELRPVPGAVFRAEGERAVTVSARPAEGATALGVIEALRPRIEAMAADWPAGTAWRLRGEAETFGSTGRALAVAVGLVFAVLALLRSFRQPLVILAMAPLSLTGVLAGLAALDIPISFPAMIGVIALVGIIVNDAIVMVQVTSGHLAAGLSPREAAAHGAADRLRPILTTSITTIVGLTPLALSSPSWYPLCMAIILGLGLGTALALVAVPSLALLLTPRARARATPAPA